MPHRDSPAAGLLRSGLLALLLGAPQIALAQGYSLGPELAQPLAAPAPAGPQPDPAQVQPGPRQLVVEVEVTGNASTKDYQVQQSIQTRRDREFDAELVQGDVRRLLQTGLFRDVKTYTRQANGGVVVVYEVFERPRINYIRYLGNRGQSDKALGKEHGLKVGDPLNAYSAQEARRKIEELYRTNGFPNTTVTLLEGDQKEDQGLVLVVNEGQLERIASTVFEGNSIASDARLRTQIESKPGFLWHFFRGKVDRAKIDSDVEKITAYYRSLGYFRARIGRELQFDDAGKWLTLKFIIDEGPRYVVRDVSVEGNGKFASGPLLDFLTLKSGKHFNQAEMNRDLSTIVDLYGSQGHVFADVQADPRFLEEPGQLDLVYRIQEGEVFRVGEINVNIGGEFPHTRQTTVLNRLGMRPGDIMDTRKIRDAERRLKASQLFEVDPQQGDPPRVAVRPPDANSVGNIAAEPKPQSTIRGQNPEASPLPPAVAMPAAPARPAYGGSPSIYSWEGPRSR
ncbi:MAG: POTRA domain-containing protein [Pirellulaceae bacterium]